jgi:hypothetical protein
MAEKRGWTTQPQRHPQRRESQLLLASHLRLVVLEAAEEAEGDLGEQDLAADLQGEGFHPAWAHLAAVEQRLAAEKFLVHL